MHLYSAWNDIDRILSQSVPAAPAREARPGAARGPEPQGPEWRRACAQEPTAGSFPGLYASSMRSTAVLREEHRSILRMLQCLERVTLFSERDGHLDGASAAELLALFKYFADGLHQEREERCLFPRLLARAHSVAERTEVGRLCGEHEQERRLMARMIQELLGAIYGEGRSLHDFRREALRYIALQRGHVLHENLSLLALAEHLLQPEDDVIIMQGFADLERDLPGGMQRVFESIEYLCTRLGVDTATTA